MKYVLSRYHEGCRSNPKDVFSYPFNSLDEARSFIHKIKKGENFTNSVSFIMDSERFRVEKEWFENHKIGPVEYHITPIHD